MGADFKISPGASLGPLVLGLSLPEIIKVITSHKLMQGMNAEFKYSSANPLLFEYIIDLISSSSPASNSNENSNSSNPAAAATTTPRKKPTNGKKDGNAPTQVQQQTNQSNTRPAIRLRFDSATQQLKMIVVDSLHTISLLYRGADFSIPSRIPSLKTILDILGPTKPGRLTNGYYELQYPGISLEFAIPKDCHLKSKDVGDLPSNVSVPLSRIFIFRGDDSKNPKILRCPPEKDSQNRRGSFSTVREESVLSEKSSKPPTIVTFQQGISSVQTGIDDSGMGPGTAAAGMNYLHGNHQLNYSNTFGHLADEFVQVIVDVDSNVTFCKLQKFLSFGDSCQDVMSTLGKPEGIYFKEKTKLAIHNSDNPLDLVEENDLTASFYSPTSGFSSSYSSFSPGSCSTSDYFFNYFSVGMDIMFDSKSHTVKKFVFHTNFPGQVDFNVYYKCFFRIQVPIYYDDANVESEEEQSQPVGDLLGYPEFAPVKKSIKKKKPTVDVLVITPDMRWEDIQRELGINKSLEMGTPLINSRISPINPFESTRLYGYHNLIFDVMHNDHLASVIIFDPYTN